jgi:transketolase
VIGYGSSKAGTHGVHGAPLGKADLAAVKTAFGYDSNTSFVVKDTVYDYYHTHAKHGVSAYEAWEEMLASYSAAYPDLAKEFQRRVIDGKLPDAWQSSLPSYVVGEGKAVATRNRSEEVLNALAGTLPELVGGSADLTPSNLTFLKVPCMLM